MRSFRSSLFWQFASGFALGTAALIALQPADGRHALVGHVESALPIHL